MKDAATFVTAADILPAEACAKLIALAERIGGWMGSATQPSHLPTRLVTQLPQAPEELLRAVLGATELAELKPAISSISKPICARYAPGNHFPAHTDAEVNINGQKSRLSMLLYLNECEGGGATVFPELAQVYYPRAGRALFFPHGVLHAGREVTAGTKYILHALLA